MPAGSIVVDLLMRTGSFSTDTDRAAKSLKKFQKQAEDVGKAIGVGLAAGVTVAIVAFDRLVSAAANFKDLEESTGATAEELASLSVAASVAGTSVENIAGLANKLTKSLSGVDDESKAAGAALVALGIPIEDFKRLNPVQQIDSLTKAFGEFADGPKKSAVAMALFGKTGAEQLRLFKALEEQGGRQVILTQQQIELADDFSDRLTKQSATLRLFAQAAATDLLPALNDLVAAGSELFKSFAGIDEAGKKLATESPVKAFAEGAVSAFALVVDAGQGVVRLFQATGTAIGANLAVISTALSGDIKGALRIAAEARQDIENILSAELFSQRLARIREKSAKEISDKSLFGGFSKTASSFGSGKPELDFDGAVKSTKDKKPKVSEAERLLETLQRQLEKTKELGVEETTLLDIQKKRIDGVTPGLQTQILATARLIDLAKAHVENLKQSEEAAKHAADAAKKLYDQAQQLTESVETPAERLTRQLEELAAVVEANPLLGNEARDRLTTKYWDEYRESIKGVTEQMSELDSFSKKFAENTQDQLGQGLFDILDGNFKNIGDSFFKMLKRMAADALAADLARKLFGQDQKGDLSGKGGLFGQALQAIGGFFGGGTTPGTTGDFSRLDRATPLAAGTDFVPHDGFLASLHKGERVVPAAFNPANGGGDKGPLFVIENHGSRIETQKSTRSDGRDEVRFIVDAAVSEVNRQIAGGGSTASALKSRGVRLDGGLSRRG